MKTILFAFIIFFAASFGSVFGQSNPGYMGRKNLIQLDINGLMGNVLFSGPAINMNWGLSYEISRSKDFAWSFGYKSINQELNLEMIGEEQIAYIEEDPNFHYSGSGHDPLTGFGYHVDEFKITPKFYNRDKGSIAPYGTYNGFEFALDVLSVNNLNNFKFQGTLLDSTMPSNIAPVYVFAISYVQGGRRMLTDNIGLDFNFGMGYTIYQSTPVNLINAIEGMNIYKKDDYFNIVAMKHLSTSRLFHGSVGISYLF